MSRRIQTDPLEAFKEISSKFSDIKEKYDEGTNPLGLLHLLGKAAAFSLASYAEVVPQGKLVGLEDGFVKHYDVFVSPDGKRRSRPVRRDLYLKNPKKFEDAWDEFERSINKKTQKATSELTDNAIYTCICAVACAFDMFKPTSRKTPGTFFEVLIGSVISEVANLPRGKQVTLPDLRFKVPTDIVLLNGDGPNLVIPTKITTRERVVQVWAQQRILQDVFGLEKYRSVLVAMSELQRDEDNSVNEICVPGQVGLFQKYLATVSGVYYLDVPRAYCSPEIRETLRVGPFGDFLGGEMSRLLK